MSLSTLYPIEISRSEITADIDEYGVAIPNTRITRQPPQRRYLGSLTEAQADHLYELLNETIDRFLRHTYRDPQINTPHDLKNEERLRDKDRAGEL